MRQKQQEAGDNCNDASARLIFTALIVIIIVLFDAGMTSHLLR
jgi:hypothetical protein